MSVKNVFIPFAAALESAGTGNLETAQTNVFEWSTPTDASFNDISMNVAVMKNLFAVSHAPDASADMTVAIVPDASGDFILALFNSLNGEAKKSDDATVDVETYLVAEAKAQIEAALAGDGIAAGLEAEEVYDLAITAFADDASNAAVAMYQGLAAAGAANLRRIIALQYTNASGQWLPTSGDSATEPTEIPFKVGDVINFRFVAQQQYVITPVPVPLTTNPGEAAPYNSSLSHNNVTGSGYNITNKIINVAVTLV